MPIQTASQALENQGGGSPFGFKNRIINGAMIVDQADTTTTAVSVTGNGFSQRKFATDRWPVQKNTTANVSCQRVSTGGPDKFSSFIRTTVTTADASIGSDEYVVIQQRVEGNNMADMAYGTPSAATTTLSFWVRSSVAGTYGVGSSNYSDNRSYVTTFTINQTNIWEYKTVTFVGDTTGTWFKNNSGGANLTWVLGSGVTTSTVNQWQNGIYHTTSSQTQLISTLNATFDITGVQWEIGSLATNFDYRPYGTELQLCQRYFHMWTSLGVSYRWMCVGFTGSNSAQGHYRFPQIMRTSPTVTFSEQNKWIIDKADGAFTSTTMGGSWVTVEQCRIDIAVASGVSGGQPTAIANNGDSGTRWVKFEAEL